MLKEEVRATVDAMGKEDRASLEAYLKVRNRIDDEAYMSEMSKRLAKMKAGDALSADEARDLSEILSKKGL